MPKAKLTKRAIAHIAAPDPSGRQTIYWDVALRGFGVLVSGRTTARSYIAQREVKGVTCRVTVGPVFDGAKDELRAARIEAQKLLVEMASGIDPRVARRAKAVVRYTLRQALDDYIKNCKSLRDVTKMEYRGFIERNLGDWLGRPLADINREMVTQRHAKIADGVRKRARAPGVTGQSTANFAIKVLKIIWNFAKNETQVEGLPERNPAKLHKNVWFQSKIRDGRVADDDLARFYRAVMGLPNTTTRDYIRLILFTGLRRREAAGLRWDRNIDFKARVIRFSADEVKSGRPLVLPMTSPVLDLLVTRRAVGWDGPYVFSTNSTCGHITGAADALKQVDKVTGFHVTLHDLRRTFASVAESCQISPYALKALLNHALPRSDITSGYIKFDREQLRKSAQVVADRLVELCEIEAPDAASVTARLAAQV